jgi:hypothetical protein
LTVPGAGGTALFTQSQIDQIVGWRNNATAQPSGSFNNYTFNTTSAVTYHDSVVLNTNGFLVTSGQSWADPTSGKTDTDQVFANRQALIAFFIASSLPQDALQYLATFTRTLDQPSYDPPIGRPAIQATTTAAASQVAPFGTGNDAYGTDRASTSANSSADINPGLLSVRVAATFTRPDGTLAAIGDALIKKRFPLSRLSLITSAATATQSQTDPIYRNFGLYRSSASSPWMYNHDTANTAGIDRLSAVAPLQREPDFFELLKAAINVGSLGKGACPGYISGAPTTWATGGTEGALVQARDNLTALQILQIGANIIDQSKADNFPTRIQFPGDTTVPPNEVRGSEDIPYLYRFHNWATTYSTTQAALFIQPELWDPYAYSSTLNLGSSAFVTAANTPKNFRVLLGPDPSYGSGSSPLSISVGYQKTTNPTASTSVAAANVSVDSPNYKDATTSTPNPPSLTFNAGELNSYWGFREPTLLGVSTMPATAHLATTAYNDIYYSANITGLFLASFPTTYTDSSGVFYNQLNKVSLAPTSALGCVRFYLQYQDSSNNWITYDESPFIYQSGGVSLDLHTMVNYTLYNSGAPTTKVAMLSQDWYGAAKTDPRTPRWGLYGSEYLYGWPLIDASNNEFGSMRDDGGISFGTHIGSRNDDGFVGTYVNSTKLSGFQHGYWAENSIRPTYQNSSDVETSPYYRYNRDPDGVARRVMGGYVTDTANGGTAPSASQPAPGLPMFYNNNNSRPSILHRPFRSVAELGYVFRDTPWGNINFSFPESGDSALLDVFCINETADTNGLVAGRVNLNTRQAPVLAALLSGTLRDKDDSSAPTFNQAMASDIANVLVARTSNPSGTANYGPLIHRSDLVGTWTGAVTTTATKTALAAAIPPNPNSFYTGFSYDIGSSAVPSVNSVANIALIPRQREAAMRALVDSGTTRTWNLLIDLIAQSGRFPPGATKLDGFVVEGEKHYWLHVAIDRFTGKVIDSQLEVVKE